MKQTPGAVEGTHVLLTGPIQGVVQLEDGTVVDVSPAFIEVDDDTVDEICHEIAVRHVEEGHPNLVEPGDDGEMVQRPFEYSPPKQFAKRTAKKATGTPRSTKKA